MMMCVMAFLAGLLAGGAIMLGWLYSQHGHK